MKYHKRYLPLAYFFVILLQGREGFLTDQSALPQHRHSDQGTAASGSEGRSSSFSASSSPDVIFQDDSLPWAIDMDGTLIRNDITEMAIRKMLFRKPWYLLAAAWVALRHSFSWQHALRFLERRLPVHNPSTELTFNHELIGLIRERLQRRSNTTMATNVRQGSEVILATASDYQAALPVAQVFCPPLFDDVIGSNATYINAAAKTKALLLNRTFPKTGYCYAGNSRDDLQVWNDTGCRAMMLVNCAPDVLQEAKQIPKPYIVIQ